MEILKSAPVKVCTLACFWISVIDANINMQRRRSGRRLQANFYPANGNFDYTMMINV
jgi:hypothetical protein